MTDAQTRPKTPLDIALTWWRWGYNVVPTKHGKKGTYVKWQKWQDTRMTEGEVRALFEGKRECGYFLILGKVSRTVVIDQDGPTAEKWLTDNIDPNVLATTPYIQTAKGRHYHFAYPEGVSIPTMDWRKRGIDLEVRSDGGGVMTAPSLHENKESHYKLGPEFAYKLKSREALPRELWAVPPSSTDPAGRVQGESSERPSGAKGGLRLVQAGESEKLLALRDYKIGGNNWFTQMCGYLALVHFHDYVAYTEAANREWELRWPPQTPGDEGDRAKIWDSIWEREHSKTLPNDDNGYLVSVNHCLHTERKDHVLIPWGDFDLKVNAVLVDEKAEKTSYQVDLIRKAGTLRTIIDAGVFADKRKLDVWLANRQCQIIADPRFDFHTKLGTGNRLLRFIGDQKAPTRKAVDWLGWHDGVGYVTHDHVITSAGVEEHSVVVPRVPRDRAPFKYGFSVGEKQSIEILKEVLTFQEPVVASVFGAWWATLPLKAHILRHTALFPFMAIEAPSESGKTTGFFSLMVQLNGNTQGQLESTIASLRDRIGSHRNGIVWIDDLTDFATVLDLVRQATSEGTRSKMAEDRTGQVIVKLVAPVVLSGESLGKVGTEKALIDRTILLKADSPIKRKSLRDPSRPQWDDIVQLREQFPDLTEAAGTLVKLILKKQGYVPKIADAKKKMLGRTADKWAILRMGARILADLTGDESHIERVKEWIANQEDLGAENALTLRMLPELLSTRGWPKTAIDPGSDVINPVYVKDGKIRYHLPRVAQAWEDRKRGQHNVDPRTETLDAITQQHDHLRKAGGSHLRFRVWVDRTKDKQAVYHELNEEISNKIMERAGVTSGGVQGD